MWGDERFRSRAKNCLVAIADAVKTWNGVVGIQIVDEALTATPELCEFYNRMLEEMRVIDHTMPIYIADAGMLPLMIRYTRIHNSVQTPWNNPVVIDSHQYWCGKSENSRKDIPQIMDDVGTALCELDGVDGNVTSFGATQVVVGEYCYAIGGESPVRFPIAVDDGVMQSFVNLQSERFQLKAGGQFFWTYRSVQRGKEWSFRNMVENSSTTISPPAHLLLTYHQVLAKLAVARARQTHLCQAAAVSWWQVSAGQPHASERLLHGLGWNVGYSDAMAFFEMRTAQGLIGADKIGMLDLWCLKRLRETGYTGLSAWVFEKGLRCGVCDFEVVVGGLSPSRTGENWRSTFHASVVQQAA